jgi:hypothetical protein
MKAFSRSWSVFKSSWSVIRAEKGLVLFPLMSSLIAIIVTLLTVAFIALVPAVQGPLTGALDAVAQGDGTPGQYILGIAVLFVYYLIVAFIATYYMTGLAGAAIEAFQGKDTSYAAGMRIARSRLGAIFGFSMISATVGVVLSLVSSRGGNAGKATSAVGGAAWSITTFLAVPVIASKPVGARQALKESTSLVTRTFGRQAVGRAGIGTVMGLAIFVVILVFAFLAFWLWSATGSVALTIAIATIGVLIMVVLALLQSALTGIYKAAVYHYADVGEAPSQFPAELVTGAFGAPPVEAAAPA